jgi:hypothetical protein
MTVAQGNPGALRVCVDLSQNYGKDILVTLGELGITGSEIWLLHKDECGESYDAMVQSLRGGTAMDKLRRNRYSKFSSR